MQLWCVILIRQFRRHQAWYQNKPYTYHHFDFDASSDNTTFESVQTYVLHRVNWTVVDHGWLPRGCIPCSRIPCSSEAQQNHLSASLDFEWSLSQSFPPAYSACFCACTASLVERISGRHSASKCWRGACSHPCDSSHHSSSKGCWCKGCGRQGCAACKIGICLSSRGFRPDAISRHCSECCFGKEWWCRTLRCSYQGPHTHMLHRQPHTQLRGRWHGQQQGSAGVCVRVCWLAELWHVFICWDLHEHFCIISLIRHWIMGMLAVQETIWVLSLHNATDSSVCMFSWRCYRVAQLMRHDVSKWQSQKKAGRVHIKSCMLFLHAFEARLQLLITYSWCWQASFTWTDFLSIVVCLLSFALCWIVNFTVHHRKRFKISQLYFSRRQAMSIGAWNQLLMDLLASWIHCVKVCLPACACASISWSKASSSHFQASIIRQC